MNLRDLYGSERKKKLTPEIQEIPTPQAPPPSQGDPLLGAVGSLAGAAVGGAVGGPMGAQMGASLGGQLGGQGTVNLEKTAIDATKGAVGQTATSSIGDFFTKQSGAISTAKDLDINPLSEQAQMLGEAGSDFAPGAFDDEEKKKKFLGYFSEGAKVKESMPLLKKFSQTDRYGNSISYEFEVPAMPNQVPDLSYYDHPGEPKGTDTVPAWLTPGERVMNAEAERMFGDELFAMNEAGRAVQAAQGGTIPEYAAGGCKVKYSAKGSKVSCNCPECSDVQYKAQGGPVYLQGGGRPNEWFYDPQMLDAVRQVESGGNPNAVSPAGAIGPYQIMPATAANPGYGLEPISQQDLTDEKKSREFAMNYLAALQARNPEATPEQVLQMYNAGEGRVLADMEGTGSTPLTEETALYGQKVLGEFGSAPAAPPVPETDQVVPDESSSVQVGTYSLNEWTDLLNSGEAQKQDYEELINNQTAPLELRQNAAKMFRDQFGGGSIITNSNMEQLLSSPEVGGGVTDVTPLPGTTSDYFTEDQVTQAENTIKDIQDKNEAGIIPSPEEISQAQNAKTLLDRNETRKSRDEADFKIATNEVESAQNDKYEAYKEQQEQLGLTPMSREDFDSSSSFDPVPPRRDQDIPPDVKQEKQAAVENLINENLNEPNPYTDDMDDEEAEAIASNVETTGQQEANKNPQIVDTIIDGFKSAFGALFDNQELGRMAIMYLGSRALGYSHGGSISFAAKNYINRVDTKAANRQKIAQSQVGKSTPESIKKYLKSGDLSDLKTVSTTELSKDFVVFNVDGKPVNGYWDKTSQQFYARDSKGGMFTIPPNTPKFKEDKSAETFAKWTKDSRAMINSVVDDAFEGKDKPELGFVTGGEIASQAASYFKNQGISIKDAETLYNMDLIVQNATRAAADYASNNPDKKITSIEPFLAQETAKGIVDSDYNLFMINPTADPLEVEYVDPKNISKVMKGLESVAVDKTDTLAEARNERNKMLTQAAYVWTNLPTEEKQKYGSPGKGENGFYLFLRTLLSDGKVTEEELTVKEE